MLTSKANLNHIITNLCSCCQIPVTCHFSIKPQSYQLSQTHNLNHYTMRYQRIHYCVFQKSHHKYMYPHFSPNHPHHIFSSIIKTETTRYSRLSITFNDYDYISKLFRLRLEALDYPRKLIATSSFPWSPYSSHRQRKTNKRQKRQQSDCLLQNEIQQPHTHWQSDAANFTQISQYAHSKVN